jgi:hypothetical protein
LFKVYSFAGNVCEALGKTRDNLLPSGIPPDVDAYCWLLQDLEANIGFHPPRHNHLLLIATARGCDGPGGIGRSDGEPRKFD